MIRRLTARRPARPPARRQHLDEGASLLIALMFVTGIGLVVGALLTYGATGIVSARATLAADQSEYDAGGALQTAINAVRTSTYNDPGSPCLTNGFVDVPDSSGTTVRVLCTGGPGTGDASGNVPISDANRPGSALLTLAGPTEPGIALSSNGTLTVKGQVRDNSGIAAGGSGSGVTLVGSSTLEAKGLCPRVVFTPSTAASCPHLPSAPADIASFADPGYAPPPTAPADLDRRSVPACAGLVTLDPGYYDDASALSNLTTGCRSRGRSPVIWFKPGQYYFDFRGSQTRSGTDVWTISDPDVVIVAGKPQGWTTSPLTTPRVPGACVSPMVSTAAGQGVQFAFGGESRIRMASGAMEICGQYSSGRPPIAIYGLTSSNTPSVIGAENGCIVAAYNSFPGNGCALITTNGSRTRFHVQGTVYAPRAALDIRLTNVSAQVFKVGVIVRALAVQITASSTFNGPAIEVPTNSPGTGTAPLAAYFSAYSCPTGSTCSGISPPRSPWRLVGQAKASFTAPGAASRGVTVMSWNLPR